MKRHLIFALTIVSCMIASAQTKQEKLAQAARDIVDTSIEYDPSYKKIDYPMGDVDPGTGVCADVIVRAMRKAWNLDLQYKIHEYMKSLGMKTDTNIDHRRVRNIMLYLDGLAEYWPEYKMCHSKSVKDKPVAGDVLIWRLSGGLMHCGIMISDTEYVHNFCCGQEISELSDAYGTLIRVYGWE